MILGGCLKILLLKFTEISQNVVFFWRINNGISQKMVLIYKISILNINIIVNCTDKVIKGAYI